VHVLHDVDNVSDHDPLYGIVMKPMFRWFVEAFFDIKSRFASRPILRPPNYDLPFLMSVDASDVIVGACLFQIVDGLEHPVCYLSKKLIKHQQNYYTVERSIWLVCNKRL